MKGREKDTVNRCLYDYFASIVAELGFDGIWWDTISLPLEPQTRRKAINDMHTNYANAACAVVHDSYLLQLDWRDDGTPCLALVLSPWFTRGWTALELAKSPKVKVLFKGTDPSKPLVKDLDDDILAGDPARHSRAHWIASSLIRRLRKPVTDVSDILTILRPRNTSWERDHKLIAALLAEWTGGGGSKTEADHTRAILGHLGKMGMSCLFHGYETIASSGPFSWCPHALRDMPSQSTGDLNDGPLTNNRLTVDAQGAVTGSFFYRLVAFSDTQAHSLVQNNASPKKGRSEYAKQQNISNTPDRRRTRDALRSYQNCILLRDHWQSTGPALLVETVGKEPNPDAFGDIIDCRYIVSVFDTPPRLNGGYDSRYKVGTVRLGNDQGRPGVRADQLLDLTADRSTTSGFEPGTSQTSSGNEAYEDGGDDSGPYEVSEDDLSDGAEGWISTDSEGPRRPRSMFRNGKQKHVERGRQEKERKQMDKEQRKKEEEKREKEEKEQREKEKNEQREREEKEQKENEQRDRLERERGWTERDWRV